MNDPKSQPTFPASSTRDTIILQCLAALLIANSHLEGLYPRSWMAADGLIGNSLFFFLSGYGLVKSEQKTHRPFLSYYLRRVLRIYPALWLVVILFQLGMTETWKTWGTADYLRNLLYPPSYGYIRQIMIFYIPFFFLVRLRQPPILAWSWLALVVPYTARYVVALPPEGIVYLRLGSTDTWLWWIFYFQMMLMGGFCGSQSGWRPVKNEFLAAGLLVAAFAAYFGLKFLMVVTGARLPGTLMPLGNFYFVLLLLTFIIVILMFQVFTGSAIRAWLDTVSPLKWFVTLAGGLTLEIYLTHEFVAYNALMKHIPFPFNIALWLAVTLGASWLVGVGAKRIQRAFAKV